MWRSGSPWLFCCLIFCLGAVPLTARAEGDRAAYLKGFSEALARHGLKLKNPRVIVRGGMVTISGEGGVANWRRKAMTALKNIPGFTALATTKPEKAAMQSGDGIKSATPSARAPRNNAQPGFLPGSKLFDDLIADPRAAHFSAAMLHYMDDPEIESVAAVSFGRTFALYRGFLPFGAKGVWQLDFEAAVFGIFDMKSESADLVNADYIAGVPLTYRLDYGNNWELYTYCPVPPRHLAGIFSLTLPVTGLS